MTRKRIFKIFLYVVLGVTAILFALYGYTYYLFTYAYTPEKPVTAVAGYIQPETAIRHTTFTACNWKAISSYYSNEASKYKQDKNHFKMFVKQHYNNNNYTDSGYVTFRFIINCKGLAGAYQVYKNSLNLRPQPFNEAIVNQLLQITSSYNKWRPSYKNQTAHDAYTHLTYKIENGQITNIMP
ncbi:hypothetical protein ACFSQP_07810 [Bizionia sediminis]|uniref:TonB C-terminal domain-containing protein n=1 Tax=Bizionia sediminis TaxID=1737064 RepID=A0ABW5KRT5_9FLAO